MNRPPPDAHSYHSFLTEVFTEKLPSLITLLSEVLFDPRLQGVLSEYSLEPHNSTLPSNEIPSTIPAESVLPASTVSGDQSVQAPQDGNESARVRFEDPANPNVQGNRDSLTDDGEGKGILKNGPSDTHPGKPATISLPPHIDGVPAADMGINNPEKWIDPDTQSVASDKPSERATRAAGAYVVDVSDGDSLASYRSDDSGYGDAAQTRPQNPYDHAYSSPDEVQNGGGQTSRRAASPPLNVFQEGAYDTTSVVSDASRHQPSRLSPIQEVRYVKDPDADRDDASDLSADRDDKAAATPGTPERSLKHTTSRRDLRGRGRRFGSEQLDEVKNLPFEQAEVLAAGSDRHQPEIPSGIHDPVAKDHSVNGTDLLSQLRDSISDMSERISRLESIVATMASKIDSFLSTGLSRPEDRTADAVEQDLRETSPSFQLPTAPRPDDVQNNQPEVVADGTRGDAPLTSGFLERPGTSVGSLASAAPAEGTPPAAVRNEGRRKYPIRNDPNGS